MKTVRERRKIIESIPTGTHYCYAQNLAKNKAEGGRGFYYSKYCPFYKNKSGVNGKCSLYNQRVIDRVKICGLKEI